MKFRKKPVVIEAEQFSPIENMSDPGFTVSNIDDVYPTWKSKTGWMIHTLEGHHEVTEGDWIITGVKGEKYPCKPDIFAMTYEKA
jgi:hypothetical protein